jgi:hypothetical protein
VQAAEQRCRCSNGRQREDAAVATAWCPPGDSCLVPVCQPRCLELFCDWVLKSSINAASEVRCMCEICETEGLALVESQGGRGAQTRWVWSTMTKLALWGSCFSKRMRRARSAL